MLAGKVAAESRGGVRGIEGVCYLLVFQASPDPTLGILLETIETLGNGGSDGG